MNHIEVVESCRLRNTPFGGIYGAFSIVCGAVIVWGLVITIGHFVEDGGWWGEKYFDSRLATIVGISAFCLVVAQIFSATKVSLNVDETRLVVDYFYQTHELRLSEIKSVAIVACSPYDLRDLRTEYPRIHIWDVFRDKGVLVKTGSAQYAVGTNHPEKLVDAIKKRTGELAPIS